MGASGIGFGDLGRDPEEVARALPQWQRGDRAEAVAATLAATAREVHARTYSLWVWTATSDGGDAIWVLPVTAAQTAGFTPRGPVTVLLRALSAALDAGAVAEGVRPLDWYGWTALELPGADEELAALAIAERNPDAARVRAARLPDDALGAPAAIPLAPTGRGGRGVAALAHELHAHPLDVALALAVRGQPLDADAYAPEMVDNLRTWGLEGEPPPPPAPGGPPGIDEDPCPRRRHARRVLQRLLRMGKVGTGYHTAVDHLYRGAPADQRHEALEVGEAMIRAGLLGEKPSVGQRHVYLRRDALPRIHALIERAETDDAALESMWSCPPPTWGDAAAAPARRP